MKRIFLSMILVLFSVSGEAIETDVMKSEIKDANDVVVESSGDTEISMNFRDVSLGVIVDYLSEVSGLIVVAEEIMLDQRLTVISKKPLAVDEAISLINTILKENGYAAVRMDRTLRIVSIDKAKTLNLPVRTGNDPDSVVSGDDIVTHVLPIRYVDAAALKENLTPLIPEYASLEANKDGNSLIITDTTANIKRLLQIIQAIDTHMSTVAEIRVFRLMSADATSTANLINNVFKQSQQQGTTQQRSSFRGSFEMMMQGRGSGGRPRRGDSSQQESSSAANVQVVAAAHEQTNSVVVRGPSEALDLVEGVIKALDDQTADVSEVEVFHLKYADADNTAQLVNQLFGEDAGSRQQGRSGFFGQRTPDTEGEAGSFGKVVSGADITTNTLVVTGPAPVLEVVSNIIKNIDAPSPEVADVKVFHLEYADAQDTAELINEVFGESRTTSRTSRTGTQQRQVMFQRDGSRGRGQETVSGGGRSF